MYQKYNARFTSSTKLVAPALRAVRENFAAVAYLFLIPSLLVNIAFAETFSDDLGLRTDTSALWPWLLLLGFVWSAVATIAFYIYQIRTLRGQEVSLAECYQDVPNYFLRMVGASVLTALAVLGGFLLFIIPGFIMLRRYCLTPYFLVDRDLPVIAAMKTSSRETKVYSIALWTTLGIGSAIILAVAIVSSLFGNEPPLSHIGNSLVLLASAVINYMFVFRYFQIKRAYSERQEATDDVTEEHGVVSDKSAKTSTPSKKTSSQQTAKPKRK